ncbi:kinase-like protein [Thelephora ganbajun]|uniref:Kinase-like protein n=1 Tax=Thelephora ganbajun TaxID=370292 RepID=A0ACB6Z8W0_THEGA|nr:kinase-like protein [Thelephora ganbajun]
MSLSPISASWIGQGFCNLYVFLSATSSLRLLLQLRVFLMASPSSPALRKLHSLDTSSSDFGDQLCNVLYGEEYVRCVPNLVNDDPVWLIDYLNKALDHLDPSGAASRKCLRELRSICGTRAILPTSYTLSNELLDIGPDPFASGGFGDVYHGTLNGSRVCVKRVRVYIRDGPQKVAKAFCKEAVMWKRLDHPNVLPLLGVTIFPLQLISNWMTGGNLPDYIERHTDADRIRLLCDIAKGLKYLHSCNVVHGDLKGSNVLVDDSGHARIADFALTIVIKGGDFSEDDSVHGHTPRWTAPEVIEEGAKSKESDIFSFAMVMVEVFTGAAPFSDRPALKALSAIMQGERPTRPTHPTFTENLGTLMQRCWDHDPHLRPTASEVLEVLLTPADPQAWKRLISHTLSTSERISLITSIFSDRDEVEVLRNLSGNDAQALINVMDEVLDSLPQQIHGRCLRYLYRICGRQALLPRSLAIPLCYNATEIPHYYGGFSDVWKGQHNGQEVAAKALRVCLMNDFDRIRRTFCREIMTWRTLRHPNVLPLLGVTMAEKRFVMVSEWMNNGNINKFSKRSDTDVDRLELLREITTGLIYMHDHGMIHGDLKGDNIMIDKDGHACLADFSLITLIPDQSTFISSCIEGGTLPWMSPELLDPESFGLKEKRPTTESDCYALGMVIYEVLSGQVPFGTYSPFGTLTKIVRGERPARPQGEGGKLITDGIWEVVERCWKREPSERASARDVLLRLGGTPPPPRPRPPLNADDDAEADSDDQLDHTPADS